MINNKKMSLKLSAYTLFYGGIPVAQIDDIDFSITRVKLNNADIDELVKMGVNLDVMPGENRETVAVL